MELNRLGTIGVVGKGLDAIMYRSTRLGQHLAVYALGQTWA